MGWKLASFGVVILCLRLRLQSVEGLNPSPSMGTDNAFETSQPPKGEICIDKPHK